MTEILELYFKTDIEWRSWLAINHQETQGIYLIFYKVDHHKASMRWEEAVKVALCFGWIDSTVKSLGDGKRKQYFCKRKPKSVWSALNKRYIIELIAANLIHKSGFTTIEIAQKNGAWAALDNVDKGIIPKDLQTAFNKQETAYTNYKNFAPSYKKSYLYWLNQAKREETRLKRISKIIELCNKNIKSRDTW